MLLIRQAGAQQFALCLHGQGPGGPWQVSTFGTRCPAAIHVGMSPDCHKLGLLEISIAAGMGADVMACGAVILSSHSIPVCVYIN